MSSSRWRASAVLAMAAATALISSALGAPASGAPAQGSIRDAGTPQFVAGSYIVAFKDSAVTRAMVGDRASSLARQYGGTIGRTYTAALRGFSIRMTETRARRLAANPAVDFVQRNGIYTITGTQTPTPSWGIDRADQRDLPLNNSYTYPGTASNVRAYVIDTGIRMTHSDFGGRAVSGWDTVDNDNDASDCQGHGTHVSGTVGGSTYGVAKGVILVGVRVLDCDGQGTTEGVVGGVDWVTANAIKPAVANMSLGGGVDSALDTAVRNSITSGITYALAAGNGDQFGFPKNACDFSPARVAEAITVGATDNTDKRGSFSNYGTCLDVFAPGVDITSSTKDSDTSSAAYSGTSMASPHAAGAAALILSANPTWTPQQVRDQLVADATSGKVTDPKTGSPNKLLYVAQSVTPPANDFSITVAPTSGTVTAGTSGTATVSTTTTAGSAQTVSLSASGLPAGATASFSPASVTSGSSSTMTISTTASTVNGTYTITITGAGSSATHTATYALTVTGGATSCSSFTNGTDYNIPDPGSVTSSITISGCTGNAPATTKVSVDIKHTYRGDVYIDLIAPDGTSYRLKNIDGWDSADNILATYTVNVSTETKNGTWKLKVSDWYGGDSGWLDTWTLTF